MTEKLSAQEKENALKRYEELQTKNLSTATQLTKEESAELDSLRIKLAAIKDTQVQEATAETNRKAALELQRERTIRKKSLKRGAFDVADAATKLAFDKEKKPNLTLATMCFIRANLATFVADSIKKNPHGWGTFTCIHDDGKARTPFGSAMQGFQGILDEHDKVGTVYEFLNIKNEEYTILKPKIRLSKLFINKKGKVTNEVEMNLPSDGSEKIATEILSPDTSDAGLKSVRVDFRNQNPFAAGRMVDVELEILLTGGTAFTKPRGFSIFNTPGKVENRATYSIKDLLLRNSQTNPEKYDGEHYGIKLEIGYETPSYLDSRLPISKRMLDSIESNNITMILQLVEYDLNFQQNGTISLILQYKGRIEGAFENKKKYDIFDFEGYSRDAITANVSRLGTEQERYDQLSQDLAEAEQKLKALHGEKIFRSREGAYEEGKFARAVSPWVAASSVITFGTGALAAGFNEVFFQDEISHFLENEEAMEKLEPKLQKKLNEIKVLGEQKSESGDLIEDLEKKFSVLKRENKVLKYSRILHKMYENKKIHNVVIELGDLIVYGPEFEASLQRKLEIIQEDESKTDEEKAEYEAAVQSIIYSTQNETKTTIKRELSKQTLQPESNLLDKVAAAIKEKATEIAKNEAGDGAIVDEDDYKKAVGELNIADLLEPTSNAKPKAGTADSDASLRNKKRIYYFYFGDLLDTALTLNPDSDGNVYNQMEYDKNGIIMGPAYVELQSRTIYPINIADIPIPIDLYQDFFYKNIVERDLDNYNLNQFVKDALNQLVAVALNQKCAGISTPSPVSVQASIINLSSNYNQAWITAFENRAVAEGGGLDNYRNFQLSTNCPLRNLLRAGRYPHSAKQATNRVVLDATAIYEIAQLRTLASKARANDIWNYFAYYLEPEGFKRHMSGDFRADAARGIHHLFVGKDRGLVKSINFRKNKKPGLTTMMVERSLEKGDEDIELWAIFDLEIKMIGTSLFKPGMHVYLNPTVPGFGDPTDKKSLSRSLGLGGYYLITSVSNEMVPGWETTVVAKWQSYPIKSDEAYKVIDIMDGFKTVSLDKIISGSSLGDGDLGVLGTLEKSPASTKGSPVTKGLPKTTASIMKDAMKEVGNTNEKLVLDQLSKTTGFQKIIEEQYYKRATQDVEVEGGKSLGYSYAAKTASGTAGQELGSASDFLDQYQEAVGKFGSGLTTAEDVQSFTYGDSYDEQYKRAKVLQFTKTMPDGSERLLTGFFYGYQGENVKNSEVFVLVAGANTERIASE